MRVDPLAIAKAVGKEYPNSTLSQKVQKIGSLLYQANRVASMDLLGLDWLVEVQEDANTRSSYIGSQSSKNPSIIYKLSM